MQLVKELKVQKPGIDIIVKDWELNLPTICQANDHVYRVDWEEVCFAMPDNPCLQIKKWTASGAPGTLNVSGYPYNTQYH